MLTTDVGLILAVEILKPYLINLLYQIKLSLQALHQKFQEPIRDFFKPFTAWMKVICWQRIKVICIS